MLGWFWWGIPPRNFGGTGGFLLKTKNHRFHDGFVENTGVEPVTFPKAFGTL